MKWYEYLLLPIWVVEEIISGIYWYFKRRRKGYIRDTSNSMADDYIEDNYGI